MFNPSPGLYHMNEFEVYNLIATLTGIMVGLLIVLSVLDEDERRNKR
jgi:hypothetical protein